jgi:UDP-N-acetylmuramoyl-L-alanyl-D-glutamate--2,6-diaminopimelate ligase
MSMKPADRPRPQPQPLAAVMAGLVEPEPAWARVEVTGVAMDSRLVRPGDIYLAAAGANVHGATFAGSVAAAGAVAVVTDAAGADLIASATHPVPVPVLVVADPREVVGELAARTYRRPGDELLLIGITGTNGKTTMSFMVEAALRANGHTTGLLGTTGHLIAGESVASKRTTPEAPEVHALLGIMRDRGVTAVVMEVSSHALAFGRVNGLLFDVVVFTNLTQDHLDFHGRMSDYFEVKATLFTPQRARHAVICVDDDWGLKLATDTTEVLPTETYRIGSGPADWVAADIRPIAAGSEFRLIHAGPDGSVQWPAKVSLPGTFNVANAVGAIATAAAGGVGTGMAIAAVAACAGVPGRMEQVPAPGAVLGLVDYAHTPDAVARAVAALSENAGRVIVVLGCGGDRDSAKRPIMGEVAARLADFLVITDDNPRSEDPNLIRTAILQGAMSVPQLERAAVEVIGDRRSAIQAAVGLAAPGDVVLILGKGHEQGQEIAGEVHPFDDRVVLRAVLTEAAR